MIDGKKLILLFISLLLVFSSVHSRGAAGKVEIIDEKYGYSVDVSNNEPFDIYLYIDFKLKGLESSVELPAVLSIPTGVSKGLIKFTKIEGAKRYSLSSKYRFSYAKYNERKPDDYLYYFPFEHGTVHRIGQGWNGSFSHQDDNYYAIDFDMDTGTKIAAARDGVVIEIKEDSKIGGPSKSYAQHGNYIMIRHSDDTFANYVHLQFQGALVNKGDRVKEGDVIGLSGNTGLSTGPHLHFSIDVVDKSGKTTSIPFKFRGKDDVAIEPKEGHSYYAYLPGGKKFEEVRGENIKISDFDDYSKSIEKNSKVDIRSERYDDRLVLFIGNGTEYNIDAKVDFRLKNLKSVLGDPISIKLNALEEKFLTVLLVNDLKKTYSFSSSINYTYKK